MPEFTKSPGWDWDVTYIDEMEEGVDSIETMTIFGVMTAEEALAEARYSLNALVEFTGAIVAVTRTDQRKD